MSKFAPYLEHGWILVPIMPGHKGPQGAASKGWNRRDKCVNDPHVAMHSAGLAHAYSGTCALDVDDYDAASVWLAERGVDLDELFNAIDAVQISSGRQGRGKLIYALPEPLASKQIKKDGKCIVDFRCATASGLTVQDVLPPSIHPDTGNPYVWAYNDDMIAHWTNVPPIPETLHAVWLDQLSSASDMSEVPEKGASLSELEELLRQQDPDMSRDDWVRVGMAIHHETGGNVDGFELWDKWSQGSKKYNGRHELHTVWRSFHDAPNAVTVGSLRRDAVATLDDFDVVTEAPAADDPWAQVAQQRRERFRLVPLSEIAQRDPPKWLVDDMLQESDLVMMIGAPGAGKSFVALDLAFSIATGHTWFNKKTNVTGPVVWIAAEAAGAMRNRARAYSHARGVVFEDIDFWVIEQTITLMDNEEASAITSAIAEKQPKFIVVDTLAAASGGANENSGEDMNVVLANCRRLHEATGALVMLIHHTGKDASRGARGWSGLLAAVHTEFQVTNQPDSPLRILEVTKQRDGQSGDRYAFKLHPVAVDMDETVSCVIEVLENSVLSDSAKTRLPPTQRLVFNCIYELVGLSNQPDQPVALPDVYDAATVQLPGPAPGKRDTRAQVVNRALVALHEKGYITIHGDDINLGSAINVETESSDQSDLSEV